MNKRFMSLSLAAALALSLSVTSFAAALTPNPSTGLFGGETKITGETSAPTIKITVPATGKFMVNPYKMEVTFDGLADVSDEIISAPVYLVNDSDVAISVTAAVTGTVDAAKSGLVLATAPLDPLVPVKTKSAFLYVEMLAAVNGTTPPTWGAKYDATKGCIAVGAGKTVTVKDIAVMDAVGGTNVAVGIKFNGNANATPDKPWVAADIATVGIAYTFTPVTVAP